MKNRYGDEYDFEEVSPGIYKITGNLSHWRFGGKEGQESINWNDLGFADPSGGPFIGLGYKIKDKSVVRIFSSDVDVFFEVQ